MCVEPLDELFLSVARLAADKQSFGVRDVTRAFDIDDTRAYRIINELVARNFVERADKGSGFVSKVSYEKLERILAAQSSRLSLGRARDLPTTIKKRELSVHTMVTMMR